jgi:methionyl-tRNA formyltransferase
VVQSEQQVLAACGERTWLVIEEVQLEGRKRVSARDFANGARLQPDERFGS